MQQIVRFLPLVFATLLAGCSMGPTNAPIGPTLARPNPNYATTSLQSTPTAPTETTVTARSSTSATATPSDISQFVHPTAAGQLTPAATSAAAAAQYNSLQFGRPGAPRAWQSDGGVSGQVVVGPLVKVNNLDCRSFTHTVTTGGQEYPLSGMACRELNGTWSVTGAG